MGTDAQYGKDTANLLGIGLETRILDTLQTQIANSPESDFSIFVHSFAEIYLRSERAEAVKQNLINVLRGKGISGGINLQPPHLISLSDYLEKLQEKLRANNDPVLVIAEEEPRLPHTLQLIRETGYKGRILYYPTLRENPRPLGVRDDIWSSLALKLMKLGNNQVSVGGQYHKNPSQVPEQIFTLQNIQDATEHGGCVGALANNVLHAIKDLHLKGSETVKISPHVFDEV